MSRDDWSKMSESARKLFLRGVAAPTRRADERHYAFLAQMPPQVNVGLMDISRECVSIAVEKYKEIIAEVWDKRSTLMLDEVRNDIATAWEAYVDEVENDNDDIYSKIGQKIDTLMQKNELEIDANQRNRFIWEILLDIEERIGEQLFIEHLRVSKVPQAVIDRLPRLEYTDAGVLYPETPKERSSPSATVVALSGRTAKPEA